MDNLNGIGTNFIGRKNLFGAKKANEGQKTTEKVPPQNEIEKTMQQKDPNGVLNSMHYYGAQNIISPKIAKLKNDPQMIKRIGDFMGNFEAEVEKGLKIIAKEFPTMEPAQARAVAARAALKASEE